MLTVDYTVYDKIMPNRTESKLLNIRIDAESRCRIDAETRDFVTRENLWQIAPLVTQKSLFTVTHALFFISKMTLMEWTAGKSIG